MKRKIFTLLLSAFFGTMAMAQAPNIVIKKAKVAPELDGVVDAVWSEASKQNIDKPFAAETPTLGEAGTTTWQALWNDDGIFLLLQVNDDEFYPAYMTAGIEDWKCDKPEIYFDCNVDKMDGVGGHDGGNLGHWQFAPGFVEAEIDGTLHDDGNGVLHASLVTAPTYKAEYFFPFSRLKDKDGADMDLSLPIGFDVTIIDGESAAPGVRQRAVWTNIGGKNESYNNMDDCGTITLSSADAVINKTATAPEVDGVIDEIWATANTYNLDKSGSNGEATIGEVGTSTWKALWTDDGMYLLLTVNDDVFNPSYKTATPDQSWEYDKPEIYFDVNAEKLDGNGPNPNVAEKPSAGHYQWAPAFTADNIEGTPGVSSGATFAFKVSDPAYVAEYFFPFASLVDKDGAEINKAIPMGFDVTIIDQDNDGGARRFGVWKKDDNWNNMDGAGLVVFDGAQETVEVEDITVAGGSITTDNGTLQMVATVEPSDANQNVKWFVENGTGRAKIDAKGVLTGVVDGTVMVKAVAKDGTDVEGKTTVTISGQKVEKRELSYITNGFFDEGTSRAPWSSGTVVDGVLALDPTPNVDPAVRTYWDYTCTQLVAVSQEDKNEPFTLSFRMWSDTPSTSTTDEMDVDFEDSNNGYSRYGVSSHAYATQGGTSDWNWFITAEPTTYVFDVIFANMAENANQSFQFMVGRNDGPIYIDSVMLIKNADLALVTTTRALSNVNKVKLYPNPVQTELTISKIAVPNSRVSVYNALGQKLMEKTANGTQAKFDVATLRKGMYFVRFSDGTSEKFTKQ